MQQVCHKAGLPADAWQDDDATLMTFEGHAIEGELNTLLRTWCETTSVGWTSESVSLQGTDSEVHPTNREVISHQILRTPLPLGERQGVRADDSAESLRPGPGQADLARLADTVRQNLQALMTGRNSRVLCARRF